MPYLLVCGGRDFTDYNMLDEVLAFAVADGDTILAGGQRGADALAIGWAAKNGFPFHVEEADWDKHGKAAGPIRNQKMLEMAPRLVIAFPGGRGTADMVRRARKAGVPVKEIKPRGEPRGLPADPNH